jgi:hypothetical protein
MSENWRGMPAHPTDEWAFWDCKTEELQARRNQYDLIIEAMTGNSVFNEDNAKKALNDLINWATREASLWESFNSSEGA